MSHHTKFAKNRFGGNFWIFTAILRIYKILKRQNQAEKGVFRENSEKFMVETSVAEEIAIIILPCHTGPHIMRYYVRLRFCSVAVSTQDSESCNPGSNPGRSLIFAPFAFFMVVAFLLCFFAFLMAF